MRIDGGGGLWRARIPPRRHSFQSFARLTSDLRSKGWRSGQSQQRSAVASGLWKKFALICGNVITTLSASFHQLNANLPPSNQRQSA